MCGLPAVYIRENSGEEVRVTHFNILIFLDFARRQEVSARNSICKHLLRRHDPSLFWMQRLQYVTGGYEVFSNLQNDIVSMLDTLHSIWNYLCPPLNIWQCVELNFPTHHFLNFLNAGRWLTA